MTDDLVERLLDWPYQGEGMAHDAAERIEALTAERERLALAICGGEDAPGYANAQTVEMLEHVAKQNQQSHGATINSLLAAEADNARLREALETCLETMGRADFADGWCCCGDDMLKHSSPMDCGHTPMDMGEYYASLALEKARAALNTGKADT